MAWNNLDLAETNTQNPHTSPATTTDGNTTAATHGTEVAMAPKDVFPKLMNELGNHRDLSVLGYKVCDLPVIVYDGQTGLHTYPSIEVMEHSQLFTTTHGHPPIVRASDHQPVTLDMSITSLVLYQWLAMVLLFALFGCVARKYKKNPNKAPKGMQNVVEMAIIAIRDTVIMPNIVSPKAGKYLTPYFLGLFFFILMCNLIGLVPGGHTATGSLAVTAALALTAFIVINVTAIRESGIGHWLKHLLGGAPIWLCFIMIPIEIISMFVKPFALTIRLFANMTAGHVVLMSLVGLIFFFKLANGMTTALAITPVSVGFSVFMYFLELLVAVLQAFIFTLLTVVFVGLAIGEHHEEHAAEAH